LEDVSKANSELDFILETNGLLLGYEPKFVSRLAKLDKLQVRVALKDWDEQSFERISEAEGKFFELPPKRIKGFTG
jgi:uncharacterized Fe-S cluster-containing radical SAM superfamily protein